MATEARLSRSALSDIGGILAWSHTEFGEAARQRYEALISAAIRHAAKSNGSILFKSRAELDDTLLSWHLANSTSHSRGGRVRTPRHFLLCRWEERALAVARVLHDRQDPALHYVPDTDWE